MAQSLVKDHVLKIAWNIRIMHNGPTKCGMLLQTNPGETYFFDGAMRYVRKHVYSLSLPPHKPSKTQIDTLSLILPYATKVINPLRLLEANFLMTVP